MFLLTEELVNPVHDEELDKANDVKQGHSRRVYHHDVDGSQDLGVPNFYEELRPNVQFLIVTLQQLMSPTLIQCAASITAFLQSAKENLHESAYVWGYYVDHHGESDGSANDSIPFHCEICKLPSEDWKFIWQLDFTHFSIDYQDHHSLSQVKG